MGKDLQQRISQQGCPAQACWAQQPRLQGHQAQPAAPLKPSAGSRPGHPSHRHTFPWGRAPSGQPLSSSRMGESVEHRGAPLSHWLGNGGADAHRPGPGDAGIDFP